ncbi:MAG: DUF4869 domain-containing protein [Butyrivibrio sp.]|nr:DUF4869 domain-containing protein [Butyrivibrio sp.]
MALRLYLDSKQIADRNSVINLNDIWFQNHIKDISFGENEQNIVKSIDGVTYAGNNKFNSKFMKGTLVDASELSTGCKTALNIATFQSKIFNIAECGDNALQLIMNMKSGNAYIDYFFMTDEFQNDIDVIINNEVHTIYNNDELDDLLEAVRE